jgi:hypothetical protein
MFVRLGLKPLVDSLLALGFKTQYGVHSRTWCDSKTCIKVKHSHEGLMAMGCTDVN